MTLAERAAAGVRWTSLSMLSVTLLQLLRLVLLARLLEPNLFGLFALLLLVTGLLGLIAQSGFGEATIATDNTPQAALTTMFWIVCINSVVLYFLLLALCWLMLQQGVRTDMAQLLPWLGMSLLLVPPAAQARALLRRNLQFRALAQIDVLAALIGTIVAVALALQGWGIWSLILGHLLQAGFASCVLLIMAGSRGWLRAPAFDWPSIQHHSRFGVRMLASDLVNYFNSRVDVLLIGWLLGTTALGFYTMALNLVLQPIAKINPVLTQVAFPVMSRFESGSARMQRSYLRLVDILGTLNAPLLIGVMVVAPIAVPLLLGPAWTPVIPVLQILALYTLLRSVGNAGGSLLLASNRPGLALRWNLGLLLVVPVTVATGAWLGALQGVAWALVLLQFVLLFVWHSYVLVPLLEVSRFDFLRAALGPVLIAGLMGVLVYLVAEQLALGSDAWQLAVLVVLGAVAYAVLLGLLRREFVRNTLLVLIPGRIGGQRG